MLIITVNSKQSVLFVGWRVSQCCAFKKFSTFSQCFVKLTKELTLVEFILFLPIIVNIEQHYLPLNFLSSKKTQKTARKFHLH